MTTAYIHNTKLPYVNSCLSFSPLSTADQTTWNTKKCICFMHFIVRISSELFALLSENMLTHILYKWYDHTRIQKLHTFMYFFFWHASSERPSTFKEYVSCFFFIKWEISSLETIKRKHEFYPMQGSIGKWKRCSGDDLPFQKVVQNSIQYHANLSEKGYRSLIYRLSNY